MPLVHLAFELGKTPDELEDVPLYWINQMLAYMDARGQAHELLRQTNGD